MSNGTQTGNLSIYSSCGSAAIGCLESGPGASLTIQATAGQTFFIVIASQNTGVPANGTFNLSLNDDDADGVTNSLDVCPDADDATDVNNNGIPDGCDNTLLLPCSDADYAEPFGTLDSTDARLYLTFFELGQQGGDVTAPFGTFDFFDTLEYLRRLDAGCSVEP